MKKLLAVVLALMMVAACAVTAGAEGADLSDLSLTFSLRNSFDGADIPVENEIKPEIGLRTCLVTISGSADKGYRAE